MGDTKPSSLPPGTRRDTVKVCVVWQHSDWDQDPIYPSFMPAFGLDDIDNPQVMLGVVQVPAGQLVAKVVDGLLTSAAKHLLDHGGHGYSVFGKRPRAEQMIQDGDRIELLGPISADPKSDRRKRVTEQRRSMPSSMWQR